LKDLSGVPAVRRLLQLGEALVYIPALEVRPKRGNRNEHMTKPGSILKLDRLHAKLLDASRAHRAAVAHKSGGFAVPLGVNPIDRIFQHRGGAAVVFRCYEYKSIRSRNLSGPILHHLMFVRRSARHSGRHGLVKERHWEGDSDFRMLEVLLHKGPLPVNTIGSISIAVDRLVAKGLVSRVESAEDRRVRIVALTPYGKDLIVPAFRKHAAQMRRVFSELSPEELRPLEEALKKAGKRSAALMEQS